VNLCGEKSVERMKSAILAFGVVVIIASLSSTIKVDAKAFFFYPVRFDYKKDKTNDGYVSTLFYTSPLTGKQYKYASNWIRPRPHQISYNYDWSYGNANTQQVDNNKKPEESEVTSDAPSTTTKRTNINNDVYKHPQSGQGKYHKKIGNVNIDAEWSYNYSDGSSSSSTTKKPSSDTTDDTAIPDESTTIATSTTDRDLDENEEE
jgi:hypothetical protein